MTALLGKLDDQDDRDWYAAQAAEHGWSRNVLVHQIGSRLRERVGAAPSNFAQTLLPTTRTLLTVRPGSARIERGSPSQRS